MCVAGVMKLRMLHCMEFHDSLDVILHPVSLDYSVLCVVYATGCVTSAHTYILCFVITMGLRFK